MALRNRELHARNDEIRTHGLTGAQHLYLPFRCRSHYSEVHVPSDNRLSNKYIIRQAKNLGDE